MNKRLWLWIPTLYFAEGIPYFIVNNISVTMLTRMGVPNGEMALFTSLLYLPWTIKPLWSPLVDIYRTKRWWILAMQALMTAAFVLLALLLPHPEAADLAAKQTPVSLFSVTLLLFVATAFASATHDIAADGFYMLAQTEEEQSFFVGIRSTFYRLSSIFGQGVLVFIAGYLEQSTGNIPLAWQLTLGLTALIFALLTLWHTFALGQELKPNRVEADEAKTNGADKADDANMANEANTPAYTSFSTVFATYFRKPGIVLAINFMLLYRLPEAFLIKMVNPFFLDPIEKGGLAMATDQLGIVYGTIGVLFLTIGGILGGMAVSRWGLRRLLWPMALFITLPDLVLVWLSISQPTNLWLISTGVALEQFGYGFGFTAYMLYMIRFAEGPYATAHYAISTAFMALSMMLPGMVAGYLQEAMGYQWFFGFVMVCCLATLAVTAKVRSRI